MKICSLKKQNEEIKINIVYFVSWNHIKAEGPSMKWEGMEVLRDNNGVKII